MSERMLRRLARALWPYLKPYVAEMIKEQPQAQAALRRYIGLK